MGQGPRGRSGYAGLATLRYARVATLARYARGHVGKGRGGRSGVVKAIADMLGEFRFTISQKRSFPELLTFVAISC